MNQSKISNKLNLTGTPFTRNISGGSASKKQNVDNIDAESWLVCNKVWKLLDSELNDGDEDLLEHRLAEIQVIIGQSAINLNEN